MLAQQQWGFDGFVLSDLGAISMLYTTHHTAASPLDAIVQFLTAGGNMQVRVCVCARARACVRAWALANSDISSGL
jgi:beta-glucosidase-like glycosyl hydrolase